MRTDKEIQAAARKFALSGKDSSNKLPDSKHGNLFIGRLQGYMHAAKFYEANERILTHQIIALQNEKVALEAELGKANALIAHLQDPLNPKHAL